MINEEQKKKQMQLEGEQKKKQMQLEEERKKLDKGQKNKHEKRQDSKLKEKSHLVIR